MASLEHRPDRRPIKEMESMVADVIPETDDTTTLVLFTRSEILEYTPGHFLTIDPHQFGSLRHFVAFLEESKGRREPPRAYSMSSTPDEAYVTITVKEERYVPGDTRYPPLLSPFLVRGVHPGDHVVFTGFTGPYTLPEDVDSVTDHLVHICAGSGAVPNFSILKHVLAHHPKIRNTFIYSNRTWDDVIFRDRLTALAAQYADRLRVVHTLTREDPPSACESDIRAGRVNAQLIRETVPEISGSLFYVCGPAISKWDRIVARDRGTAPAPRFMEAITAALESLDVREEQIVRESYG